MTTPNWKNGAAWEAIPTAALYSTYGGTYHVDYPRAIEFDGLGTPCGAVGRPQIVIESPWMTDTGFGFWRARFSSVTDTYCSISIEGWDPRTGAQVKWAGKLHWPTFRSIGVGAAAGSTVYRDVKIVISDCETTS